MFIMTFKTQGTCARQIEFEIDNNIIHNVRFTGGCMGNTQGVARLVEGMEIHDAISRMEGIDCNGKGTSCPDQLAKALKKFLEES